jgi:hypothetical protein
MSLTPSQRLTATRQSSRNFVVYVIAPKFTPLSGGARAMYLLAHHLDRLGYDAFVPRTMRGARTPWPVRYLDAATLKDHISRGSVPIVVYPEMILGNPLKSTFVVRYLLNKPGLFVKGAELGFGARDYFITFAPEHAPKNVSAFDVFLPLVDRSIYFPPPHGSSRHGFALFSSQVAPNLSAIPEWLAPTTIVSARRRRSHEQLGQLYRQVRALVTSERTTAIYEALTCGCPVICLENGPFREGTYQRRFGGAGLVWGWHQDQLAAAQQRTAEFRRVYAELEGNLDQRIRQAFDSIIADVERRLQDGSEDPPAGELRWLRMRYFLARLRMRFS